MIERVEKSIGGRKTCCQPGVTFASGDTLFINGGENNKVHTARFLKDLLYDTSVNDKNIVDAERKVYTLNVL